MQLSQYMEYDDLININCCQKNKSKKKTWHFIVLGVPSTVNKGLRVRQLVKTMLS